MQRRHDWTNSVKPRTLPVVDARIQKTEVVRSSESRKGLLAKRSSHFLGSRDTIINRWNRSQNVTFYRLPHSLPREDE